MNSVTVNKIIPIIQRYFATLPIAERVGLDLDACRDDEVDYTITF